MNNLAVVNAIPSMTVQALSKARELETFIGSLPQFEFETKHTLHAGVYSRTIFIPKGYVAVGAYIIIPTTIIISGHGAIFIGDETKEIKGYVVMTASYGRKQAFLSLEDSYVTMLFKTEAKTIEEAEEEFTDEANKLQTRRAGSK